MKFTLLFALCICQAYADLNLFGWGSATTTASSNRCGADEFRCRTGQCIKKAYLCDNDRDCPGGEDERNCRASGGTTPRPRATASPNDEECGASEFDCGVDGAGRYGRCIPNSPTFMCDGARDCANGADERNCRQTTTEPSSSGSRGSCKAGEFQCGSGRCLKPSWVCDGDQDCADGEDEQNCRGRSGTSTTRRSPSTARRTTLSTRGTTSTLKPLHLNGLKVVTANSNRLWYKPAASKEECAQLCADRAKCRLSTFDKNRKVCTAYAEDVNAKFALDEDFSTYGRWTETATRYPGQTITGTDLTYDGQPLADWLKIQWSEPICTQICHVHPKCDLALWNTKTNKCALKTHSTQVSTTPNPNVVATVLEDDNDSRSPSPNRG